MTGLPFAILPTDLRFYNSPDAGELACICSRCQQRILEHEVPIRVLGGALVWSYEYRFHPRCLGFKVYDQPELDAEAFALDEEFHHPGGTNGNGNRTRSD